MKKVERISFELIYQNWTSVVLLEENKNDRRFDVDNRQTRSPSYERKSHNSYVIQFIRIDLKEL